MPSRGVASTKKKGGVEGMMDVKTPTEREMIRGEDARRKWMEGRPKEPELVFG